MRATPLLALLALLPGCDSASRGRSAATPECVMVLGQRLWVQRALDDWERASREVLHVESRDLPWIVLVDTTCQWHLAPDTLRMSGATPVPLELRYRGALVSAWSEPHRGVVKLPTGDSMPVSPAVFAAVSSRVSKSYLVLAMPSVFRMDSAAARDTLLDLRILSVVSHEIQHTVQLPDLQREIDKLGHTARLPAGIDDNIVERRFSAVDGFRTRVLAERDLLLRAAFEPDAGRARAFAREALTSIRQRRARYFMDSLVAFDRLEDLFFTMEGSAEWVRFKIHQALRDFAGDRETVAFIQGKQNDWSQDEGLALFLVLDRFSADWRKSVLAPEMTSPVQVLEAALGDASRRPR